MRKIVPTTMLIDDRARALIEKCVLDFASSVTNIAVGYCAVDAITTQPLQQVQGNLPLLPNPASVVASAAAQRELKSSHIMRSLDNMGYAEYQKPLLTYKVNLKGKPVQPKVVPVPVARTAPVSAAPAATKKQKGPTGNPVATAAVSGAYKPVAAMSSGAASSQQHADANILLLIDDQLRNGPEVLTVSATARKFKVSNFMVSKRVTVLQGANVEMKGLTKGHSGGRVSTAATALNNSVALQAAKKFLAPPTAVVRRPGQPQVNSSGASGGAVFSAIAPNNTLPSSSLPAAAAVVAAPGGAASTNPASTGNSIV